MVDVQISRNHNLDPSELRSQLEDLAADLKKKYGLKSEFCENEARLSGSTVKNGAVTWSSDSLAVELKLGLAGKIFKKRIEKEIEKKIDEIVGL